MGHLRYEKTQVETKLKEEQDKTKKMYEIQKILADLKSERDLLMKELAQSGKDRDQILDRFKKLREETDAFMQKIKDDFARMSEAKRELEK